MQVTIFSKKLFFVSIALLIYFLSVFTGIVHKIDFPVVGAIYELITIPLILLVFAVFLYTLFQFIIKKQRNYYLMFCSIICGAIIALMFIVE